jgi:DNA end-binding protein Ku
MPTTIWKGHLTFGLVSFPVKLSRAARGQTAHFHLLHASDHSRIQQRLYCAAEDKPVPRDQLVKGYEYQKERYVAATDEELRQVAPRTATVMEILEFVPMDQVDPVYLDSSYHMAPGRGGERPYALLFEALRQERYYGLAQLAMHHREHIVILRPGVRGLLLHTMFYVDEVRQQDECRADCKLVRDKELELARLLIPGVEEFRPEKYHDRYRQVSSERAEANRGQARRSAVPARMRSTPVAGDQHLGSAEAELRHAQNADPGSDCSFRQPEHKQPTASIDGRRAWAGSFPSPARYQFHR